MVEIRTRNSKVKEYLWSVENLTEEFFLLARP